MESSTPSLFENAFQRRSQPLNKNIGIVHLSDEDVGCFLILLIKQDSDNDRVEEDPLPGMMSVLATMAEEDLDLLQKTLSVFMYIVNHLIEK